MIFLCHKLLIILILYFFILSHQHLHVQDVWVPAPGLILPDEDQTGAETFKMTVELYIGDIPKSVSPYLPKLSSLKKVTAPNL